MNGQDFSIINNNGGLTKATALTTFTLFNKRYCIYSVAKEGNNNDIFCSQLINNQLLPIKDDKERLLTNQIVKEYLKSISLTEGTHERRK